MARATAWKVALGSYARAVPRAPRPGPAREKSAESPERILAVMHEVANLLAAARMSGHFLAEDLVAAERVGISRDVERLMSQSAALLGQLRPLLDHHPERLARVKVASLLSTLSTSLAGAVDPDRLKVAKARALPEVRVDADAIHHVLVSLVTSAIGESEPDSKVRVTARLDGDWIAIAVIDAAPKLDLGAAGSSRRGRELGFALADDVLKGMGGRAALGSRTRGNQVELVLPVGLPEDAKPRVRRPRAGRGAPRRP
jgi:signal transduction histidine kinase